MTPRAPRAVQTYMVRRESGAIEQVRPLISGEERPGDHWAPGLLALYTELGLERPAARLLHWLLDGPLAGYRDSAQWPCVLAFAAEAALWLGDEQAAQVAAPDARGVPRAEPGGRPVRGGVRSGRPLPAAPSTRCWATPDAADRLDAALELDTRMAAPLHQAYTLAGAGPAPAPERSQPAGGSTSWSRKPARSPSRAA